ncbi:hypothetical protein LTR85_009085 [Meristemomyces frigidus]|nr:hypothetical protein LTR85_009085 [Meristemomyces frigidus]
MAGEADGEPAWLATALQKRKIQATALQPYLAQQAGLDDETITAIASVEVLASRIATGEFTAYDVVSAYVRKAVAAHHKTNCLTEIMFDGALQRAHELDDYYENNKKPVGPLHGVVMTLKDQFNVKGFDTTLGYVGRTFRPASEDAVVVAILKQMGVVFIAKTNLPQSIMWCETENPLWGLTTHPLNPGFTPGGSTGGEGALLAQHGSLVGWGTDIGGSSGRIPYLGVPVSTEGQEHVPSVVGPMARSLSSLRFVTKTVIDAAPWKLDPQVHPLPWREEAYQDIQSRPLVIGLLIDDGIVKVHPHVERIVREVAAKLQKAGHEVIEWDSSGHSDCIQIMDKYYTADGGEDVRRDMSAGGEPYIPHVEALVNRGPAISVYEYWQLHQVKRAVQKTYLDKWQRLRSQTTGREADILLTPTMPHSAVPHRSCKWVGYTKVWNLLDYTTCVLPVGTVDQAVDTAKSEPSVAEYVPRNELDKWNWALYDPEALHGMPLSVQLVGQRLEEEKVLGAAEVVAQILSKPEE